LRLELRRARGALLASGAVRQDRTNIEAGGATLADLWGLTRAAMPRYGLDWRCEPALGANAILVRYGGATVQRAWLGADYLATISMTGPDGSPEEAEEVDEMTQAGARLLASCLESHTRGR